MPHDILSAPCRDSASTLHALARRHLAETRALRSERDEEARRRSELEHELQEASKEANALRSQLEQGVASRQALTARMDAMEATVAAQAKLSDVRASDLETSLAEAHRALDDCQRTLTDERRNSATALALSDEAQERASRMAVAAGERVRRLEAGVGATERDRLR